MRDQQQIDALAEAMAQLLDDMGDIGQSVCLEAKARARIAYEPFRTDEMPDWMTLAEAQRIVS
jgi:hypothetical protein